jgi:hypothetical protein
MDANQLFEQYGEQVIAFASALGSMRGTGFRTTPVAPTHAMRVAHAHQDAAAQWLTEWRDLEERRRIISMILSVALLVFLGCSAVVNLWHGRR